MRNGSVRRRQPPKVLRTPIQASHSDGASIARQTEERVEAFFQYYGVDRSEPIKLIQQLVRERFPSAFRVTSIGARKTTKKAKWTTYRKAHIYDIMWRYMRRGISMEAAAEKYKKLYCPQRGSVRGVIAEYHRARKFLMSGKAIAEVNAAFKKVYAAVPQTKDRRRGHYSYFIAGRYGLGGVKWGKRRPPSDEELVSFFGPRPKTGSQAVR